MATPPDKTPLEVIYAGAAAAFGALTYYFGRRRQRKEYLKLEPVTVEDFEQYKILMDTKFKEADQKQVASNAAVLSSVQNLRVDWAKIEALEEARDKRMDRIEERLNLALDKHPE